MMNRHGGGDRHREDRGMHGLRTIAATAAMLAVLGTGCATVEIREARTISGQVTDESGQPVPHTPVVVVGRSLDLVTMRLEYQERGRQEARTATDAGGRYRLEFVPADLGNNFFLFFYDTTGFDRVKYQTPQPLDITRLLSHDWSLLLNQVLQFNPAWPEVERQIAFYGPDSERGRILRTHGLPEKREFSRTGGVDTEVWWYYTDGVSYWFSGGQLIRAHQFQPLPGAASPK
jgi:hypothetical protein